MGLSKCSEMRDRWTSSRIGSLPFKTVFLLVIVIFATCSAEIVPKNEGTEDQVQNNTLIQASVNITSETTPDKHDPQGSDLLREQNNSVDNEDWSSDDDPENSDDVQTSGNNGTLVESKAPGSENETISSSQNKSAGIPPVVLQNTPGNITSSGNSTNADKPKKPNDKPDDLGTTDATEASTEPTTDIGLTTDVTTEEVPPTTTDLIEDKTIDAITDTTPDDAKPIITQDPGDSSSDYSSTQPTVLEPLESAGLRTWAVVVFTVLFSFAVIFTILYCVRRELIRRRKADQRELLQRASISNEGFFYGDEEGNGGKFEL